MVQKWSERDNLWVWVFEMNEEVPEGLGQCWTSLRWNKIMAKEDANVFHHRAARTTELRTPPKRAQRVSSHLS
jgi:hypothetical protein